MTTHWLLRHAERGPLPPGLPGDDVPLLPAGVEAARRLGASLGPTLARVHTSPVPRCVQTATALLEGAGRDGVPSVDPRLGAPGVYVLDGREAWHNWTERGGRGVIAALIAGEQLPGMADPIHAARVLFAHLLAETGPGVHVWVTHDSVLAPTVAHLLGIADIDAVFPAFLEALVLAPGPSSVVLSWRGARREVPPP